MTDQSGIPSRLARLGARLTYANVIATLALFMALGGVGYAASELADENADEGFALWDGRSYSVKKVVTRTPPFGDATPVSVFCDSEDPQIGGGFRGFLPEDGVITSSSPTKKFVPEASPPWNPQGWTIIFGDTKPDTNLGLPGVGVTVVVRCADFGDRH